MTINLTENPGGLYPIALNAQTLVGVAPGSMLPDIYNGTQPGNFGWLTCAGSPNEPTVSKSLTPPGDSFTYKNPANAGDNVISIGDWVQGKPGVSNSNGVRDALDVLKTIDINVPIWSGDIEFTPRKQIASLAYIAATLDDRILLKAPDDYAKNALALAKAAASQAPDREKRLDKLVDCGAFLMEAHPRFPTNWLSAVEGARPLGARLSTFEEWYGAYDGKASVQLVGMVGHYEWVIPWVYEPTIHSRLHELYRGKPVACYYEELSPLNDYPFRLVVDGVAKTQP